ncbi:MAG: glutamine synthetase family protein [Pseudomonadota bacterium]
MADRLRLLFCDALSISRGKYLPASKIGDGESRFCQGVFGTHYDKDLLDVPGSLLMHGLPDMEARYSAADIRESWEPGTKVVVGDLYGMDGEPLGLCGRGALKRAVSAWQAHGLNPKVGIELECFAFTPNDDGKLVPYDNPGAVVYGTGAFADPLGFNDAIWEKAEELGFSLDCHTAEYDAPQFEYTLMFDNAVKAIDDMFLFRLMAREIALEFGVVLTFMPKPIAEAGGSGLHINFSFTDARANNAIANGDKGGPDNLNDLARGCLAGLMHHHKGLAGLIAPNGTSYQRLQPASLSGYWQNWGGDHRGVTARVSGEGDIKARLEHRMADAASNPYTATAAVLQAALLGVENKYELQPMEGGDCFAETEATVGVAADLGEAVADLETDTALSAAVGQDLVDNHVAMKRHEHEKTKDLEGDTLRDFYIHYV